MSRVSIYDYKIKNVLIIMHIITIGYMIIILDSEQSAMDVLV